VFEAGVFVTSRASITGSTASTTTVVATWLSVTFREARRFAIATVPVQLFAIERGVTPAIGNPGSGCTSTVAVDDITRFTITGVRAIAAVSVAVRCTVAGAGGIPCGFTAEGVEGTYTVFTTAAATPGTRECITSGIGFWFLTLHSTIDGTKVDTGCIPLIVTAEGVDGANAFFAFTAITTGSRCRATTGNTVLGSFAGDTDTGFACVPFRAGIAVFAGSAIFIYGDDTFARFWLACVG